MDPISWTASGRGLGSMAKTIAGTSTIARRARTSGDFSSRHPNSRVQRIPITSDILVEAIETKVWPLKYPPHQAPTVRWDIRVNQLLVVVPVLLLALWLWQRFVG